MHAKATITLDERYYAESYAAWLRNVSKWRRSQIFTGPALIIVAVTLFTFAELHYIVPVMLLVFGICEIGSYFLNRYNWMRDRLADRRKGAITTLEFFDDRIIHAGPFARGEMSWNGIESVKPTPNGLFLRPQRGISIYIPDWAWERSDEKQLVLDHITQSAEQGGGATPLRSVPHLER
jgi:hypothetical protein